MNRLLSIVAGVFCVSNAYAYDFSAADQLFAKRGDGSSAISRARAAYTQASNQTSGAELIYAVEQIARLDGYEAMLVPDNRISQRKPILDRCLQSIEKISPDKVGANPEYLYWKVTCRALWCEANGTLKSLRYAQEIVDLTNAGLALDASYEGGGFNRAAGVIYSELPSQNPFGPSGNLPEALRHFQTALNAPAYGKAKHPDTESGDYHYPNYFYYARALVKSGQKSEAASILDDAIERIESGEVPNGREPETRLALKMMKQLRARL